MQKNLKEQLFEKKKILEKLQGKEMWSSVEKNLEKKKKEMSSEIKKKFKILQDMVIKSEKKALSEL